jgi:hypothetical protein
VLPLAVLHLVADADDPAGWSPGPAAGAGSFVVISP